MIKRAQVIVEYAVVIACMVAALAVMQAYFRRGLSGKIKSSVDGLGEQFDPQEGDFTAVSGQKGESVSLIRVEEGEGDAEGEIILREVSYSASGPQAVIAEDGEVIIEEDSGRMPITVSSYETSTIDWKDLGK